MIESILSIVSNFIINFISDTGYIGITILMAIESAAIPIPSEVIMPFSGYLVSQGNLNFWLVSLWGALGNVFGSIIAYYVGFWGGRPLLEKYGKYFLVRKHELDRADSWFNKYGQSAIFFSRLMPAVRTFISIPAGVAKMRLEKFIFYTFAGSLPWSLGLTYIGYKLGTDWESIKIYFRQLDVIIVLIILGLIGWWVIKKIKTHKNYV